MTVESAGAWTKRWWLRLDQFRAWSADEHRAFKVLILTWAATAGITALPVFRFLRWVLLLNSNASLWVGLILAGAISLPAVRRVASSLFPNLIIRGDDAAAARLGGHVYLPTNEFWIRGFWWIDAVAIKGSWSDEQMKVRKRTLLLALCIFVPALVMFARALMSYGLSERTSAVIAFTVVAPVALYGGRRISICLWPELVRKADDDAVGLANKSVPPRL